MSKLAIASLAVVAALSATAANAQCRKYDCSNDPGAWGAALGGAAAQQAEASRAAQAVVAAQQQQSNAALIAGMGLTERRKLLYSLETTLTRLSGKPATVVSATVHARAEGYLFCGGALYGGGDAAPFVLDTRPGAMATLKADRGAWVASGCEIAAITLR